MQQAVPDPDPQRQARLLALPAPIMSTRDHRSSPPCVSAFQLSSYNLAKFLHHMFYLLHEALWRQRWIYVFDFRLPVNQTTTNGSRSMIGYSVMFGPAVTTHQNRLCIALAGQSRPKDHDATRYQARMESRIAFLVRICIPHSWRMTEAWCNHVDTSTNTSMQAL